MNTISRLAGQIQAKGLAVFCGAGISFDSGMPLANQLLHQIFIELGLADSEISELFKAKLPFESIADVVSDISHSLTFLNIYRHGSLNANHRLIAAMAIKGYVKLIVTTNFDSLIEKALMEEGLPADAYQVFADEAHFESIDWKLNKLTVIKIHGSIEKKHKMAVTLKMVANKQLSFGRNAVVQHLFEAGRPVLFLGYSFSDHFDITPQIKLLQEKKAPVYIVAHKRGQLRLSQSNAAKNRNYPLEAFETAIELKMDTNAFLQQIAKQLSLAADVHSPKVAEKWSTYIHRWFQKANEKNPGVSDGIAGRLYFLSAKFRSAAQKYHSAFDLSQTDAQRSDQLRNLGIVYTELQDYDKALSYLYEAKTLAESLPELKLLASILNNIGYCLAFKGDYDHAKAYRKNSFILARRIRNQELLCINYNNFGILQGMLKEYDPAIRSFNRALRIMEKIGFIQWIPRTMNNIGIATRLKGNPEKAIELHEEVLLLSEPLGFKDEKLLAHENLGRAYKALKQYSKAVDETKKADSLAVRSGKKESHRKCLKLLLEIFSAEGNTVRTGYYRRLLSKIDEKTNKAH